MSSCVPTSFWCRFPLWRANYAVSAVNINNALLNVLKWMSFVLNNQWERKWILVPISTKKDFLAPLDNVSFRPFLCTKSSFSCSLKERKMSSRVLFTLKKWSLSCPCGEQLWVLVPIPHGKISIAVNFNKRWIWCMVQYLMDFLAPLNNKSES